MHHSQHALLTPRATSVSEEMLGGQLDKAGVASVVLQADCARTGGAHRQRARLRFAPLLQAKEIQNEKCVSGIAACEATGRRQWCSADQRRLQNLQPLSRVEECAFLQV